MSGKKESRGWFNVKYGTLKKSTMKQAHLKNVIEDDYGFVAIGWSLVIMELLEPLNLGWTKTSDSALKQGLASQRDTVIFLIDFARWSQYLWWLEFL